MPNSEYLTLKVRIPDRCTLGEIDTVRGAIFKTSTEFIDWESLYNRNPDALSNPGLILLAIANALDHIEDKAPPPTEHGIYILPLKSYCNRDAFFRADLVLCEVGDNYWQVEKDRFGGHKILACGMR